ncbi:MAG TPA: CvpA family protein [Flavisolibacter sp.]|nr:CvpA family protein [Flavisolibacter sp.]
MFLDLIVLVLLVIAIFKGLRKGFIVGVFSFLAFLIGLAAALKLSAVAAGYIVKNVNVSQQWLPVIAFALVFILVVFLVNLSAKALEGLVQVALLGWLNRLGGVLLFSLLYLFIFSILLFYAESLHFINPDTVQASVTYPFLHPLGPKVMTALSTVIPFFKNMFGELTKFFENVSKKV